MKTSVFAVMLAAATALPAAADRAEDDLQLVRKAVASPTRVAQARPPAEAPADAKPAPRKGEPRWLRVRISEKGGKHGHVAINLPIGIARALGEDWPVSPHGKCHRDHCPTLGEVLRALDSGQSLFEIDDDEASVRVWVD